jgi:hypothetical protein
MWNVIKNKCNGFRNPGGGEYFFRYEISQLNLAWIDFCRLVIFSIFGSKFHTINLNSSQIYCKTGCNPIRYQTNLISHFNRWNIFFQHFKIDSENSNNKKIVFWRKWYHSRANICNKYINNWFPIQLRTFIRFFLFCAERFYDFWRVKQTKKRVWSFQMNFVSVCFANVNIDLSKICKREKKSIHDETERLFKLRSTFIYGPKTKISKKFPSIFNLHTKKIISRIIQNDSESFCENIKKSKLLAEKFIAFFPSSINFDDRNFADTNQLKFFFFVTLSWAIL